MEDYIESSRAFHDYTYSEHGIRAQRIYPSEDIVRFAKKYLSVNACLSLLDAGTGGGANSLALAEMSSSWRVHAIDFCELPVSHINEKGKSRLTAKVDRLPELNTLDSQTFDVVIDHMCSYGLMLSDLKAFIKRLRSILRPEGLVYIKTLSDQSDLIKYYPEETLVEKNTLRRIVRRNSPFPSDNYLFRFTSPEELAGLFRNEGFSLLELEKISRTYRDMEEYYEQISAVFRLCKR